MPTEDELVELLGRALDEDAPAAPPPDRIAALRARAEAAHAVSARRRRGRGVSPWLAAAAAIVALAAGFAVARVVDEGQSGTDGGTAGEVEYEGPMNGPGDEPADAELKVTATGIGRIIDVQTDVLPILPVGEYYQVWFVGPGDSPEAPNRISAGTFHPDPDGRSDVQFAAAVNPELYPIVEITAEPGDGNPLATGPVVLRTEI